MDLNTISRQLLYSTLRIEVLKGGYKEAGTGFIFNLMRGEQQFLFLVTNRHVVEGAQTGSLFFTKAKDGKPDVGKRYDMLISEFSEAWTFHPEQDVDIAVMPLAPVVEYINQQGVNVFCKSISSDLIPTDSMCQSLDALESVLFIGYPNGLYDTVNLLPIIRTGTTATPIYVDYSGSRVFLIDASVFPGSSGSPVLIVNQGSYIQDGGLILDNRVLFLGVVSRVVVRKEQGYIEFVDIPAAHRQVSITQQMIDLGVVYKASQVVETCERILRERGHL